jgi:ABC-2 type transport system permease protein
MSTHPAPLCGMPDRPLAAANFAEPGIPRISSINGGGLVALYVKEVRRFFKVQLQTIWAPAITTLLYLVIFTVALSGAQKMVHDIPFADFLAPGLIMMGMLQNSFANASFGLLVAKIQGTIIDYLMPPLGLVELLTALVGAAMTRAIFVGFAVWGVMLLWPGVHVAPKHIWAIAIFGLLGSGLMAFLGVLTSIWAEKFDHAAAVTNFVVLPLSLLSGTFYSVEKLSPTFAAISHANPIFHIISGFRYGFTGVADAPLGMGIAILVGANFLLAAICYGVLKSGWKIKA